MVVILVGFNLLMVLLIFANSNSYKLNQTVCQGFETLLMDTSYVWNAYMYSYYVLIGPSA